MQEEPQRPILISRKICLNVSTTRFIPISSSIDTVEFRYPLQYVPLIKYQKNPIIIRGTWKRVMGIDEYNKYIVTKFSRHPIKGSEITVREREIYNSNENREDYDTRPRIQRVCVHRSRQNNPLSMINLDFHPS